MKNIRIDTYVDKDKTDIIIHYLKQLFNHVKNRANEGDFARVY